MSHFCKVVDNKVVSVIVAEPEFFDTFVDSSPGTWLQCSYNTRGNKHYNPETNEEDGGIALRGNYPGIGYNYDATNDVFIAPKPSDTAVLNETTWLWEDTVTEAPQG